MSKLEGCPFAEIKKYIGEKQMIIQPNTFIFNIGMAAILSIIIGLERQLKKKPLGLKTCLVIGSLAVCSQQFPLSHRKNSLRPI